jgi:hypothetical protein
MKSVAAVTGNGTSTSFSFAHGLTGSNFGGFAQAASYSSRAPFPPLTHVEADNVSVTLHFATAPANAQSQNFNIEAFAY